MKQKSGWKKNNASQKNLHKGLVTSRHLISNITVTVSACIDAVILVPGFQQGILARIAGHHSYQLIWITMEPMRELLAYSRCAF
jgi:hypothetical protein